MRGGDDASLQQVLAARWPRALVGTVVGATLAVAGVIIQELTRNPLGGLGLSGVPTGACVAVVNSCCLLRITRCHRRGDPGLGAKSVLR
ncbi:iron chelate uptake ABC transporter family permease subunit [Auritidibacter ignavus]|uniref:iron chelate uptake ABC transporter family permease subunit n=1 Tax=Auritidibacter ignavus TaxID=678932 RepID=UPI00109C5707|nr:iron chelate uptake ABC transporter family permease subunit [Auritidibacter ignavus]